MIKILGLVWLSMMLAITIWPAIDTMRSFNGDDKIYKPRTWLAIFVIVCPLIQIYFLISYIGAIP